MNTDTIINFLTVFTEHWKNNIYIFMLITFNNHIVFDLILNKPRVLSDYDRMLTLISYGVFIFVMPFIYALYKTYYMEQASAVKTKEDTYEII